MDKTDKLDCFVTVVRAGTFSSAARQLLLTPSAVSRLVSRLESEVGATLFDRTTKSLKLTEEGRVLYEGALRITADIEEIYQRVSRNQSEPHGRLRISSSVPIGVRHIQPLLPKFVARYPKVQIDLSLSDEVVDMVAQGADVAIRVGPLKDSTFIAKKLCSSRRAVVACPDYLSQFGTPKHPSDLSQHACLAFNTHVRLNDWPFLIDGSIETIAGGGNISANNGETLRHLALTGAGIARLAWFQIGADVRDGRLIPLLEEFHPQDLQGIYAIFFKQKQISSRVRSFVDFLSEELPSKASFLGFDDYQAAVETSTRQTR